MTKKYKVIGYQYELCHRFELGTEVEFVSYAHEGAWYKDSFGLEQILVDSEIEEIK